MQGIHTFIQSICSFLLTVPKKAYRTCAVITTGIGVVTVVAFSARQFGGSGRNSGYGGSGIVACVIQEDVNENDEPDILQNDIEAQNEDLQPYCEQNEAGKTKSMVANDVEAESEDETASIRGVQNDGLMMFASESLASNYLVSEDTGENADADILEGDSVFAGEDSEDILVTTGGTVVERVMRDAREVTEEEYNILTHIVAAEAGNCDVYGQILVANVVFNRMDDKHFPDTVEKVVFQKNQFSPAMRGTIWKANVSETTIEAVDRALAGEDYSCGAVFFAARKYLGDDGMSNFDKNYEWLFEHDGHEFYRFYE